MEQRVKWMMENPIWRPWKQVGWTLMIVPGCMKVMAINKNLKMATAGAMQLTTIVSRLAGKKYSYLYYVRALKSSDL